MPTREEVEGYLSIFHVKMKVFGIIYRDDRGKNQKALEELEIVPSYRKTVIEKLKAEDYVEGPLEDALNKLGEMWVFGKSVKKREIYIKITMGIADSQIICISFHIAQLRNEKSYYRKRDEARL
ncbi:MAG: toxin [Bacteroidales bacterium]|nr:toxin [Bacteroidales bacterium]